MTADALVSRHEAAWRAATVHPFLAGVRDGSLPEDCFDRWLAQDYLFAQVLVRAQARIAAAAPLADVGLLVGGVVAAVPIPPLMGDRGQWWPSPPRNAHKYTAAQGNSSGVSTASGGPRRGPGWI